MTLAAGFKFEHPKALGLSPILLVSDSRYSFVPPTRPPDDRGKKVIVLTANIAAVFDGNVSKAREALTLVGNRLVSSFSRSFEELRQILKSSFDATINWRDLQPPHCLLGAISTKGDSKLFYAQICGRSYEVTEVVQKVIGDPNLEPKLQEKIDAPKPNGLYHPKHFMCLPDDSFGYDPRKQAVHDAKEISASIGRAFLETVDDPSVQTAKSPLQNILLLPSKLLRFDLYDIASSTQIKPKTWGSKEVN